MAVRKIAMVVNLRQNKNETSQYFGKWYPEVDEKKPLDLKGFCRQQEPPQAPPKDGEATAQVRCLPTLVTTAMVTKVSEKKRTDTRELCPSFFYMHEQVLQDSYLFTYLRPL